MRTINVAQSNAWQKHRVRSVPTYILIKDGQEVSRASGVLSEDRLRGFWRKFAWQ